MSNIWRNDLVRMGYYHPNLCMDVSGDQSDLDNPLEYYRRLRREIDMVGPNKILFGSDYPFIFPSSFPYPGRQDVSLKEWVETFKEIPQEVREAGIEFTDAELAAILGDNAKQLLRL